MHFKHIKNGFTLMEMLVVSLIIGILAAVAIPRYELAVERARMSEGVSNLKTIAAAQQLHFLEAGAYTNYNMDLLAVGMQGVLTTNKNYTITKNFSYAIDSISPKTIYAIKDNNWNKYYLAISLPAQKISCISKQQASAAQVKLCDEINSSN